MCSFPGSYWDFHRWRTQTNRGFWSWLLYLNGRAFGDNNERSCCWDNKSTERTRRGIRTQNFPGMKAKRNYQAFVFAISSLPLIALIWQSGTHMDSGKQDSIRGKIWRREVVRVERSGSRTSKLFPLLLSSSLGKAFRKLCIGCS